MSARPVEVILPPLIAEFIVISVMDVVVKVGRTASFLQLSVTAITNKTQIKSKTGVNLFIVFGLFLSKL
jgi:uncharacterized membrane protein